VRKDHYYGGASETLLASKLAKRKNGLHRRRQVQALACLGTSQGHGGGVATLGGRNSAANVAPLMRVSGGGWAGKTVRARAGNGGGGGGGSGSGSCSGSGSGRAGAVAERDAVKRQNQHQHPLHDGACDVNGEVRPVLASGKSPGLPLRPHDWLPAPYPSLAQRDQTQKHLPRF
jgi:hypothetical protein